MRIFALAAAVSMSLTPAMTMAQGSACPANSVLSEGACVCAEGFALGPAGSCLSTAAPDVVVAVDSGELAGVPLMSKIPPEAFVVGGLVILAGVIIGIAAASDDDAAGGTTTTTTTATTTTN